MQQFILFSQPYPGTGQNFSELSQHSCSKMKQIIESQAATISLLTEQIVIMKNQLTKMTERIQALEATGQSESEMRSENVKARRKKFNKKYYCPYNNCQKFYGSALALNLHIKQKHNGGTKKQRQAYAKIIFNCQQKGLEAPEIQCDFPPGFLQEERKKYIKEI